MKLRPYPPPLTDRNAFIAWRCASLRTRWGAAWDRQTVPGVYPARPYPWLHDEAAWSHLLELERYIEAEIEE